jgi:hypothetical protein
MSLRHDPCATDRTADNAGRALIIGLLLLTSP